MIASEPEAGLVVAELRRSPDGPTLAPAVSRWSRATVARASARRSPAGRRQTRRCWRARRRDGRRSSSRARHRWRAAPIRRPNGIGAARIGRDVERGAAAGEPPEAGDVERRQPALRASAAGLTCLSRMRQSPDGASGVPPIVASPSAMPDRPRPGDDEIERGERQRRRGRAEIKRRTRRGRRATAGRNRRAARSCGCRARRRHRSASPGPASATLRPPPCAVKARKVEPDRRPAGQPAMRLHRKAATLSR